MPPVIGIVAHAAHQEAGHKPARQAHGEDLGERTTPAKHEGGHHQSECTVHFYHCHAEQSWGLVAAYCGPTPSSFAAPNCLTHIGEHAKNKQMWTNSICWHDRVCECGAC
eukprot:3964380-Alexandrium_andersonii.AAC.1